MIILGIDPGLATMGWGVIETNNYKNRLIDYGAVITSPDAPTYQRLRSIQLGVENILKIYHPDDISFEELFFSKNITTGMNVAAARGAALVACAAYTENLYEYTPMQIKQAIVGYGKADKHQMQHMVKILLNMEDIPRPDDAADGLAAAITHSNSLTCKEMFHMK